LTSVKGNIQLAQRRLKNLLQIAELSHPEERRIVNDVQLLLERAVHQTGIQNRLINDLLDVSRIDAHKLELSLAPHDLRAIVHDAVENLHSMIPSRQLLFECAAFTPVFVMVDIDRIGQVIANYVTNAFKYSEPSEPIVVGLTVEGTEAKVWVRDLGPGLIAEEQEKIWHRFYQVPNDQTSICQKVGLGLGLYLCQTLIERHNGNVGVESQPGQGSTFWFTLPVLKET
jgi:signal transduction histidine kinase